MKHVEIINRIIEAEQQAQRLADEAHDKRANLKQELASSTQSMQQSYREQAQKRVDMVREREQKSAEEQNEALRLLHQVEMDGAEARYREHRDEWVETLFNRIIDR